MSKRSFVVLRFDAPVMSFGGVLVDKHGETSMFPGLSLLTGLLGNALGYAHNEPGKLTDLQNRISYGVRRDRYGKVIRDFQTVDLTQSFMKKEWTTFGATEGRGEEVNTHIRYRYFLADCVFTVVFTLNLDSDGPDIDTVVAALVNPQRPLFIGRKPCLPATGLFLQTLDSESVYQALGQASLSDRADEGELLAWWPGEDGLEESKGRPVTVTDERDWDNQIHVGRRVMWEGVVNVSG